MLKPKTRAGQRLNQKSEIFRRPLLKVPELMSSAVVTVGSKAPLREILQLLLRPSSQALWWWTENALTPLTADQGEW